jgi:hypothetical protein
LLGAKPLLQDLLYLGQSRAERQMSEPRHAPPRDHNSDRNPERVLKIEKHFTSIKAETLAESSQCIAGLWICGSALKLGNLGNQ